MMSATKPEHDDLMDTLALHRNFLLMTAKSLDDEQWRATPTASDLSIGAIIKHVSATEAEWATFITGGAAAYESTAEHGPGSFDLAPEDTAEQVMSNYADVASRTAGIVNSCADLGAAHLLPAAPWFPPGAKWSVRRVVMHLIAETAQHAGHADIIRESLDGAKTMG